MTNWLFFMNAGVGPMQGQSNHFTRYAPEHIQYGVDRYQNETKRLYGVLDKHLAVTGNDYIVGNKYTVSTYPNLFLSIESFYLYATGVWTEC